MRLRYRFIYALRRVFGPREDMRKKNLIYSRFYVTMAKLNEKYKFFTVRSDFCG